MSASGFQSLVQLFFTDRLRTQLGASPHTIAAYRDTFRLLLQFASKHLRRAPSQLRTEEIDAPFVGKFLEHLELTRGNGARTRNNRLAALHAFFRYVAVSEPGLALHCQRVLTIPSKRYDRGPVAFLAEEEAAALVQRPMRKRGSANGTGRCCWSPFKRGCAIARSHPFAAKTWNLGQELMSAVSGRAARCAVRPSGRMSPRF